jgi:hypothetical protein
MYLIWKLSRNSLHTFVKFINACSVIYRVIQNSTTIFNNVVEDINWSWKSDFLLGFTSISELRIFTVMSL